MPQVGNSQARDSNGTLLQVGNPGSPETFSTIALVQDIPGIDGQANMHDTSTQDGAWATQIPSLLKQNDFTFDIQLDLNTPTHEMNVATGLWYMMANKILKDWRILPAGISEGQYFSAYVSHFAEKFPVDGSQMASITLSPSGAPTFAG